MVMPRRYVVRNLDMLTANMPVEDQIQLTIYLGGTIIEPTTGKSKDGQTEEELVNLLTPVVTIEEEEEMDEDNPTP